MAHFDEGFGDFDYERDREFCVREIPDDVSDWGVFHIFKKFGTVESLRIPANQRADSRHCFVSMFNFIGASNVRAAIQNGKLIVGRTTLRVSDVRTEANIKKNTGRNNQPIRNGHQNNRRSNEFSNTKLQKIAYSTSDLPIGCAVKVLIVPSPFPSDGKEGLTFHLINTSKHLSEAYTELQQEMNTHCHNYENASGTVAIGTPIIFYRNEVAYRAVQSKVDKVYLVDMGREERIVTGKLFRMMQRYAILPTLVITCSLARVEWKKPSKELFNSIRQIIQKWCDSEGCLVAKVEYFVGSTSMIHLEGSSNTNLAKSLAKRGDLTIYELPPNLAYNRDEIYRIGNESKNYPLNIDVNRHAETILLKNITKGIEDIVV